MDDQKWWVSEPDFQTIKGHNFEDCKLFLGGPTGSTIPENHSE